MTLHSGDKAPKTGDYIVVGPRGGEHPQDPVTIKKGDTLPPTPKPNQHFKFKE